MLCAAVQSGRKTKKNSSSYNDKKNNLKGIHHGN
jgi:hypothetical protein